ncbi:MAG: hypothetical protein GY906_21160 [bacterium]|nr:hypothetical protein [bacterium]
MKSHLFWSRWLECVGWTLVVLGLGLAFFNQSYLFDAALNRQIDPAFWADADIPDEAKRMQAWIYGVLGATVSGWGVLVAFISRTAFRQRQRWSWTCLLLAITLWYLVDTGVSVAFGVYFNAAFNTVVAASAYIPLMATSKAFADQA